MLRTVHSMIRLASMVALLLSIGAIGLGKLSPNGLGRTPSSTNLLGVSTCYRGAASEGLQLFDLAGGPPRSLPLSSQERVDLATGSPWVDAWDQVHVAGRWLVIDPELGLTDCGLSRVAIPSGEVLDRVSLDHYPVSPPCWGAGTTARVLFVAGDGNLYRYDFEPISGSSGLGLKPVRWHVESPDVENPVLVDVMRPERLLSPDLLIATVMSRSANGGPNRADHDEIWWLRLSEDEQTIIDCGPITRPDPEGLDVSRRRPSLGVRSDGSLCLAYLSWKGTPEELYLRVLPVRLDEQTGTPIAEATRGRVLADSCLNHAPVFVDGGSSLLVQTLQGREPMPLRVPLDDGSHDPTLAAVEPVIAGDPLSGR
ncbi:hypothetical protein [Tautonia marina]|uniref:hypothetical protein n=1 Tax=Tautonia marina TaxID=2653855 RepID=UPI001260FF23|nr:hypothetical protein [Tautonia marina]